MAYAHEYYIIYHLKLHPTLTFSTPWYISPSSVLNALTSLLTALASAVYTCAIYA
ncbi:ATM_1a_G0028330.mRNA.1.CDS.1 [Saccharomyces cerevisiae]|nr:ATM_1a_G0028330.mRNA.1.CDS.1 [Saccharomyces cerevisiae]CAI7096390.1 ATM_1a_G0028330.mRNA.1.CDS.1 [Saccharomyces cerevisiae]